MSLTLPFMPATAPTGLVAPVARSTVQQLAAGEEPADIAAFAVRPDVEGDGPRPSELADRVERAVVGRCLLDHHAGGGVHVVERGFLGAGETVGVGGGRDLGLLALVGVRVGILELAVDRRLAVIDVDAQAHAGAGEDAQAVGSGIEVDRERSALRQLFRDLALLLPFAALHVDRDDGAVGGDAIELAVGGTHVDADQAGAAVQLDRAGDFLRLGVDPDDGFPSCRPASVAASAAAPAPPRASVEASSVKIFGVAGESRMMFSLGRFGAPLWSWALVRRPCVCGSPREVHETVRAHAERPCGRARGAVRARLLRRVLRLPLRAGIGLELGDLVPQRLLLLSRAAPSASGCRRPRG